MSGGTVAPGTWFCVPLMAGGLGVGLAVLTDGVHNLSVFFRRRYESVPALSEMASFTPADVVWAETISDYPVETGDWPELGVLPGWSAEPWVTCPPVAEVLPRYDRTMMGYEGVRYRVDELAEPPVFPLVDAGVQVSADRPLVVRAGGTPGEFCLDFWLSPSPRHELAERAGLRESWVTWRSLLVVWVGEECLERARVGPQGDHVELVGDAETVHRVRLALMDLWSSDDPFKSAVNAARTRGLPLEWEGEPPPPPGARARRQR